MRPEAVNGRAAGKTAGGMWSGILPWIFFAATALFYCRGMFEGKILIAANSDEIKNYICSMMYVHQWAPQVYPLWNTMSMCGHPFGVAAVGSYNAFNLASIFIDPALAYSLIKLAMMFLNGAALHLFLRRRCEPWAAAIPAWIWMILRIELDSGFFLLPVLLLLGERFLERPGKGRFAALVLTLAVYNLNTNPQFVIYTYLFLFAYLAIMGPNRSAVRNILWAALPFVFAAGLSGFFWVRAIETLLLSNRAFRSETAIFFVTHFPQWIFPRFFEIQDRPDLGFVIPRILQTVFSWSPITRRVEVFMPAPYLGITAVAAFLFYAIYQKARAAFGRQAKFFFWAGVGIVGYLALHPILYILIVSHIPVLQGMTGVVRLFLYVELSALVLMGHALHVWFRSELDLRVFWPKLAGLFAWALGGLGLLLVAVRWVVRHFREDLLQVIAANLRSRINPTIFVEDPAAFGRQRAREFFEYFDLWISGANPNLWVPATAVAVLLVLLAARAWGRIGAKTFRALLLVFVVADVGLVHGFAWTATPPEQIFKDQDAAAFFQKDPELFRVLMVEDAHTSYHQMFLVPEMNLSYRIATPDGYEYFNYLPYLRFYEWLTRRPEGAIGGYAHPLHDFDEELADFLNCKYLLTSTFNHRFETEAGYRKAWENSKYRIYENLDVLPRVFSVRRAAYMADDKAVAAALKADPARLRREVLLVGLQKSESGPNDAGSATEKTVAAGADRDEIRIVRYTPHEVVLDARLAAAGYVVMTDNYFPGWKAALDGQPVELLKADFTFRAVRVPQGEHRIRFWYDPASMNWGWALAGASLAVFLLFVLRYRFEVRP